MPHQVVLPVLLLVAVLAHSSSSDGVPDIFETFPVLVPAPGFYLSPTPPGEVPVGGGSHPPTPPPVVTLEMFVALACKDSKAAWEPFKEVARTYHQHRVAVKISHFPLPYHRNDMVLAQGAVMVLRRKPEMLEEYMEMAFDHLEEWKTKNSANETDAQILERLVEYTEQLTGLSTEEITEGIKATNRDVRNEWKLGCSRGVSGTPTIFVNGVRVVLHGEVTLEALRALLDRLLGLGDGSEGAGGEESAAGGGGGGEGNVDGTLAASSAKSAYRFW